MKQFFISVLGIVMLSGCAGKSETTALDVFSAVIDTAVSGIVNWNALKGWQY